MDEAKWYIVHTYSGYENKVADNLATIVENRGLGELIQEIRIPTETVTEIKDGKKRDVERKLFPSYVFVKMVMSDDTWFIVRNTRGCTGFVGPAGKPTPLTEAEVESLGVEVHEIVIDFAVGDTVRIIDGPLENFTGHVEEIDADKNKVKVLISMFGRETSAEVEIDQVELFNG